MKNVFVTEYLTKFTSKVAQNKKSLSSFVERKWILEHLGDFQNSDDFFNQVNNLLKKWKKDKLKNNTVLYRRAIFKIFYKWYALKTQQNPYQFEEVVITYEKEVSGRTSLTPEEIILFDNLLKEYNDERFAIIYNIFLYNGIRKGEWENIDWEEALEKDFAIQIKTEKRNNVRPFTLIGELKERTKTFLLKGGKLDLKKDTIGRMFVKFGKYIKNAHPEIKRVVTPHVLRHTYITQQFLNNANISEIALNTGHKTLETILNTYITHNPQIAFDRHKEMQKHLYKDIEIIQNKQDDEKEALYQELKQTKEQISQLYNLIKNLKVNEKEEQSKPNYIKIDKQEYN
ncbi:tyrosine-type recombinase/integrase [[Mycoplasma] gypis]|uniref:tyrosine-type recombinase/integrase n=1 Tax=[Mycoplasma] gypis TaxID=92404 RepID=UPI0019679940|nr:tyrosine-type recombinase/integrase [[Mycoplasma] gypis]MBN0919687.1 tyrosine-type recombinase/integrase [[Mycoplasma] gypis]